MMLTNPVISTKLVGNSDTIVAQPKPGVNTTVAKVLRKNSATTFPQKNNVLVGPFSGAGGIKVTVVISELPPILAAAWVSWTVLINPLTATCKALGEIGFDRRGFTPHPSSPMRSAIDKG